MDVEKSNSYVQEKILNFKRIHWKDLQTQKFDCERKRTKLNVSRILLRDYSSVPTTKNQIINKKKEREKKTHGNRSIVKVGIKNIF